MNLGELLNYAQNNEIEYITGTGKIKQATIDSKNCEKGCHVPYHKKTVAIGKFKMQSHSHDTGNSVVVYIIGAGDPYCILRGTYWKCPGYNFNKFYRERGAWDTEFSKAESYLREAVGNHQALREYEKNQAEIKKMNKDSARKRQVETMFVC